jgi:hypothetical protein
MVGLYNHLTHNIQRGNYMAIRILIDGGEQIISSSIPTTALIEGSSFIKQDGSVTFTSDISLGGNVIQDSGTPALNTDLANKLYVDTAMSAAYTYASGLITAVVTDCGNWDASSNVYPSTGGTGTLGAILKGNLWFISVSGTLGGVAVMSSDSLRALVDSPGQTASNWEVLQGNLGFIPANQTALTATNAVVAGNTSAISTLNTGLATANTNVTNNTTAISGNTANIATLISGLSTANSNIATNTTGITNLNTTVTGHTSSLTTLSSGLATANTNISANTSAITTLNTGLTTTNTNVTNNTTAISSNTGNITTLTSGLSTANSNITANTASISTLNTSVASHTTSIATANTNIANNTTSINSNTANISNNTSSISTLNSGLATANTNIATNTTGINSLNTSLATTNSNVAANTASITTLNTNVAANTSTITGNTTSISTLNTNSATKAGVQAQTYTAFTTGGTSTAYTLTPSPAITSYVAYQSFYVNFNAACGASPTLTISGVATPPNLVYQVSAGTYANITSGQIPAGHNSRVTLISTTQALVETLPPAAASAGSSIGLTSKTANYSVLATDKNQIIFDSNQQTYTLPTVASLVTAGASTTNVWWFEVWCVGSVNGAYTTVVLQGTDKLDLATSAYFINRGSGTRFYCDGTNFYSAQTRVPVAIQSSASLPVRPDLLTSGNTSYIGQANWQLLGLGGSVALQSYSGNINLGGTANGSNDIGIGVGNIVGNGGVTFGYNTATGRNAEAGNLYGADNCASYGYLAKANPRGSMTYGAYAVSDIINEFVLGGRSFAKVNQRMAVLVYDCTAASTDYTLTTDGSGTSSPPNKIYCAPSTTVSFTGIVTIRQKGSVGNTVGSFKIDGVMTRQASGNVSIVTASVTAYAGITNPTGWTVTLAADTSNQCLSVIFNMGSTTMNLRAGAQITYFNNTYA